MPFFFIDHQGLKHPTQERWAYYGIDDPGVCERLTESKPRDLTYDQDGSHFDEMGEGIETLMAGEIMSSPVVTINDDQSLQVAIAAFKANDIRHLPVLSEEDKLIGLLSERDVVSSLAEFDDQDATQFLQKTVSTCMAPHAVTVTSDTPVEYVVQLMQTERVGSLPVLEYPENQHLLPNQIWHEAFNQGQVQVVGIITKSDVLSCTLKK